MNAAVVTRHATSILIGLRMSAVLLILMLSSSLALAQQVYKCKDARGNPVFAQSPCSADPAAVEVVDTSRSLKTGSSGPLDEVISSGDDSCGGRQQAIAARYIAANNKLDQQMVDANDMQAKELQAQKDQLKQAEIDELVIDKIDCSKKEAKIAAAEQAAANPGRQTASMSWRCALENGLMFYRHDGCPVSIRDRPANPLTHPEARSQPLQEMPVIPTQIPHSEACEQINSPEASKRWGNNRDQKPQGGKDDC